MHPWRKKSSTEVLAGSSYLLQLLHCPGPDYFLKKKKKNLNVELDNEEIVAKKKQILLLDEYNVSYCTSNLWPYLLDARIVWQKFGIKYE